MNALLTSSSNLQVPLLTPPHDQPQRNARLFLSDVLHTENNESILAPSVIGSYILLKPPRLNWVYQQLLQMHFEKEVVKQVLKGHARMLDYNYTREELLNRAIDYCLLQRYEPLAYDDQIPPPLFIPIEQEEEKMNSWPSEILNSVQSGNSSETISQHRLNLSRPQQPNPEDQTCQICLVENENLKEIDVCMHKFCFECLFNYVKSKIEHYEPKSIKCPSEHCGLPLSEEFIAFFLKEDQKIFEKYEKFKAQIELLDHPERKWCIRPDCPHYVEKSPEQEDEKVKCQCGQEMCFACGNPWHERLTCLEAVDKEYQKYEATVTVKQCPKCCSRIEKNEGCNHMTCSRCKHEFCWVCKAICINGYCVNKCPKFPEEFRRRNRIAPLREGVFLQMRFSDSCCENVLKLFLNVFFFIIFSHLVILLTPVILIFRTIKQLFYGENTIMTFFESSRNMNITACEKAILKYACFPIRMILVLLFVCYSFCKEVICSPLLIVLNQMKLFSFLMIDRTAFSICFFERMREFAELYIGCNPRNRTRTIYILLMTFIYIFLLTIIYYEILRVNLNL